MKKILAGMMVLMAAICFCGKASASSGSEKPDLSVRPNPRPGKPGGGFAGNGPINMQGIPFGQPNPNGGLGGGFKPGPPDPNRPPGLPGGPGGPPDDEDDF